MDDVVCSETESTLTSCSHITNHSCVHDEDAGVQCQICEFFSFGVAPNLLY